MNRENMSDDPVFDKAFGKMVDAGSQLAKIAVEVAGQNMQEPHRINLAIGASAGPIGAVAVLIKKEEAAITQQHILLAALLISRVMQISATEAVCFTWNMSIVLETMEDFERLTGQKADKFMHEDLVLAARDVESEGAVALDTFMAARPSPTQH